MVRTKDTEADNRDGHMHLDLDTQAEVGPNPPPWEVRYVNDKDEQKPWYGGILPEAHTLGLSKYNDFDLQIRLAPPHVAAPVLDRVGLWVYNSGTKLSFGDTIRVLEVDYTVTPAIDAQLRPVLRLAWHKDPVPERRELIAMIARFRRVINQ